MTLNVSEMPIVTEVAKAYGLTSQAFVQAFTDLAMPHPHTASELIMCILSAREAKLNPLMREIFFKRTEKGEIQGLVKVDGWIKICNSNPNFDGMEFETEKAEDGKIASMTCSIWIKGRGRPTKITEEFAECARGGGEIWLTHPNRMMRNRTLSQCARVAFGISGIMEESEFTQWQAQERAKGELTREPVPHSAAPADDFIPDVPVDDLIVPDVPPDDPVPAADVATGATDGKTDEATVAEFREALAEQGATVALVGELRAVYEDAIEACGPVARSEIQDSLLGALIKLHAKAKTKPARKKVEAEALDLLDHLSDAGRRTIEALFDGRKQEVS
jgi:hypothetical protein